MLTDRRNHILEAVHVFRMPSTSSPIQCLQLRLSVVQVFLSHRGWADYGPRAKSGQQTVFLNRVLLEHSHAHICLQMVDGHFYTTTALSSCNRTYGPESRKYSLSGPLQKKSLETLALDDGLLATFPSKNTESLINQNTPHSGNHGWRAIHILWVIVFICSLIRWMTSLQIIKVSR